MYTLRYKSSFGYVLWGQEHWNSKLVKNYWISDLRVSCNVFKKIYSKKGKVLKLDEMRENQLNFTFKKSVFHRNSCLIFIIFYIYALSLKVWFEQFFCNCHLTILLQLVSSDAFYMQYYPNIHCKKKTRLQHFLEDFFTRFRCVKHVVKMSKFKS